MNPFGTRARAEELAALLDGVAAGERAPEGAVPLQRSAAPTASTTAGAPAYAALAADLRTLGAQSEAHVAPRAEFRAALRTRLVAVASVQPVPAAAEPRTLAAAVSWTRNRSARRGLGFAAGAMASVVALTGVAVAGSMSLPGDPFYSVKRGGEALELRFTSGTVAKGSKHLELAAERLKEVRELALGRDAALAGSPYGPLAGGAFGGSTGTRVLSTLADMDRETRTGSDLLTSAYRASNDTAPLQILSRFAGRQSRDLQALLPDLPTRARSRAAQSLALVSGVALDTSQLLAVGVCTDQCNPTQAPPSLPPAQGGPAPQPGPVNTAGPSCGCPPAPGASEPPAPGQSDQPGTSPAPAPQPSATGPQHPRPSSTPTPLPLPTTPAPLPTALPSGLPTALPSVPPLPVPLPTITPSAPALPAVPGVSLPALPTG